MKVAGFPVFDESLIYEGMGTQDKAIVPAPAEDRRVKRTRNALKTALITLLRKKVLRDVTTSELCRVADINRNTFYSHYRTPEDVFDDIQEEYFNMIRAHVQKVEAPSLYEATCAILRTMKDNYVLAIILSQSANTPNSVIVKSWNLAHESWLGEWASLGIQATEGEKERAFTFAANGYCAVLVQWIRSGMREDVEVIAKSITDMARGAFRAAFED